jgi:hypothetical protein
MKKYVYWLLNQIEYMSESMSSYVKIFQNNTYKKFYFKLCRLTHCPSPGYPLPAKGGSGPVLGVGGKKPGREKENRFKKKAMFLC